MYFVGGSLAFTAVIKAGRFGYMAYKGHKLKKAAKARSALARRLGNEGERAVGITGSKTKISINGRTRIPDRLGDGLLEEVKNVKHLNFTRQLRDFHTYSQQNNLRFVLYTRSNTTLSGPLKEAINNGSIIHKIIPGL